MTRFGHAASAVALLVALSTSAQGQVQTDYTYDVHGRLTKVTRPDSTTNYTYDNAQNRTNVTTTLLTGNRPPVPGTFSTLSVNTGQSLTLNPVTSASDPDNDTLTITGVSTAAQGRGTTSFTANSVTYAAGAQAGADSFTYTLSDGKGGTASGAINVTINATAPPPIANNSNATVVGNSNNNSLSLNVTGGAPTAITVTQLPQNGSATGGVSWITFTPTYGWSGQTSLQYTATNSGGTSSPATVAINVRPVVNAVSGSATAGQQTSKALSAATNYSSLSLASQPSQGSAYISGGAVYYTPSLGASGSDTFAYQATTAGGTSSPANISFSISPAPPAAPGAGPVPASTAYNTPVSFALAPSGNYTSLSVASNPSKGSASISGTTATYSPSAGSYGSDSFTYTASGPGGTSSPATVSISIGTPPAPVAGNVSVETEYNTAKVIPIAPSGAYTGWTIASQPQHGTANYQGGGAVIYNPSSNYSGSDSFTYVVNGPGGQSAPGTMSVTVKPPASAPQPVLTPDSGDVHSRGNITLSPLANDSDPSGYPLTITAVSVSGGGSATITNGGTQILFQAPTVATRANKTVTITYTVSNGHGGTASSTISVVVETEYYD